MTSRKNRCIYILQNAKSTGVSTRMRVKILERSGEDHEVYRLRRTPDNLRVSSDRAGKGIPKGQGGWDRTRECAFGAARTLH
jgi:hypothetical protein